MRSGYNIVWTDHALNELQQTLNYLEENWTAKDISNFAKKTGKYATTIKKQSRIISEIRLETRRLSGYMSKA